MAETTTRAESRAARISAVGSRRLPHLFGMVYDQSLRYRMLSLQTKDFPRAQSRREHQQSLDAALARDATQLTAVLDVHITKGLELYMALDTVRGDAPAPLRRGAQSRRPESA